MSKAELHRGRLAQHPRVISVRPLVRDDLNTLKGKRIGPPRIKSYREAHHRIARLIASGLSDSEVAARTGYSIQRVGTLKSDPSFAQLIAEYREKIDERWLDQVDEFYEAAVSLKLRGIQMMHEHFDRAEEEGELIPLLRLSPLVADLADRTGHGKHSSTTTQVQDFAKMMEQMAKDRGRSNVIDAKPLAPSPVESPLSPEPPAPQGNQFAGEGFRRRIAGRQG